MLSRGILPEHFVDPQVRDVYEWASGYSRRYGQTPALHVVQERFPAWVGGYSEEPIEALCDEFIAEIRRRAFESKLIELSMLASNPIAYKDMRLSLDETLLEAARHVASVAPTSRVSRFTELESRITDYEQEKGNHRPGIPLGIPVIDQTMGGGVKAGWLITYAGYSGLGKSGLGASALLSAFEDDKVAMMLTLEMSRKEVLDRLDTMVMQWRHQDLMQRNLTDAQVAAWRDTAQIYSKARGEIVVVDKLSGCSLDRVHAEIERHKPDIVCLDYVQRMRSAYNTKRPKWEQLEEITNELKTIAMDTDTAIIMVSQDGRDAAEQGSTRTNMGGSISVYQAADAYIGMMRDDAMAAQKKMRLKMLKFRHGSSAEVDVFWDPEIWRVCDPYKETDQFVKQPPIPA